MIQEITVRELVLSELKHEYIKRAHIISELSYHIEKLCMYNIINNTERTKHIRTLNQLIKAINSSYNNRIDSIKANVDKFDDIDDTINNSLKTLKNIENLSQKIKLPKEKTCLQPDGFLLKNIKIDDFNSQDETLKNIAFCTGTKTIGDAILLFVHTSISTLEKIMDDYTQLFDILQKCFIPVNITTKNPLKDTIIKITKNFNNDKYEILLDNLYTVDLNVSFMGKKTRILINGYFEHDNINTLIRTSQICSKILNDKKKFLIALCDNSEKSKNIKKTKKNTLNSIQQQFKQSYVKNLSIGDILSHTQQSFIDCIYNDYAIYQKYSTMTNFKSIFTEFTEIDLLEKFKMIKFLLMDTRVNDAGLLFSFIKESKFGSTMISDIIYRNLNFPLQTRLKKTNISIKSELDKLNNIDISEMDLKKQILMSNNMPKKVKRIAIDKLNELKTGSEYCKQLLFIKTLIDYPWSGENDGDVFMLYKNNIEKWKEIITTTETNLNKKIYGHLECKDVIIDIVSKWLSNPKSLGKSIGIEGPPGVGKTLIAKILGESIGIPTAKINLGGMSDGAILSGHSITYSAAIPGLIIQKIVQAEKPRLIFIFDELDKTNNHHGRNEIFDILIHLTDQTSNTEFNDNFFQGIDFTVDKIICIFTFNDRDKIDPILLDRMEIIEAKSYNMEDKINIVLDFLINDIKIDTGLNDYNIKMSKDDILYLIENYTNEPGIRTLKRKLEKIFLKLNRDRIFGTGLFEGVKKITNIQITKDIIAKYLPKPTIIVKKINVVSEIGHVSGLYATSSGHGGIIPILMYKRNTGDTNKFSLKLTGKQGKVMRESVEFAFTIASNLISQKTKDEFFDKYPNGIHIHTPDGATTKDGPSAGSAFTLAFLSVMLNKRVKNTIALTGEIDEGGSISAIGGLEYKLPGAKRAGVKLVFIPKENEKHLEKLIKDNKTLFDNNFKYIFVEHVTEILDMALLEDEYEENSKTEKTFKKLFDYKKYQIKSTNIQKVGTPLKNIKTSSFNKKQNKQRLENLDSEKKSLISNTTNESDTTSLCSDQ